MAEPINLNKARKAQVRSKAKQKADENAIRFGRTKAQRLAEAAQDEAAKRRLDQLKFESE